MNVILLLLLLPAWQTDSNELWLGISSTMRFRYVMDKIRSLPMVQVFDSGWWKDCALTSVTTGLFPGERRDVTHSSATQRSVKLLRTLHSLGGVLSRTV